MKKALYSLCYAVGLAIGILLCIFNYQALNADHPMLRYILIATGIIFIIPGVVQLISSLHPKRDDAGNILKRSWYSTLIAILALLWGISILCMPDGFAGNLSITLGVSVILAGLAQIVWIVRSAESTFLRFIIPLLTIASGLVVVTLLNNYPDDGHSAQMGCIVSGITLVVWSVNGFMALRSKRVVAAADKAAKSEKKADRAEEKALDTQRKKEAKTEADAAKKESKATDVAEKKKNS